MWQYKFQGKPLTCAESPTENAGEGISEYLRFIFPLRKYGGTEDLEDNFMKSEFTQVALALRAQITTATDGESLTLCSCFLYRIYCCFLAVNL